MALRYELNAQIGEYKDANGNIKKKNVRVGVIMDSKNGGFVLKMEAIPLNWDGWAFLNEPQQHPRSNNNGRTAQTRPAAPPPADDMDDDIPF